MALYEIMGDIARRQVEKTETGDNRIYGILVGQVTKNYDREMPGRVCVKILTRDENANELLWARVAMPSGGPKWGHYFLPEENDEVLVAFEQGNIERPYIIGCVQKASDEFLKKSVDEKNKLKRIMTRHGSKIVFEDNPEDEAGGMDKIIVNTAGEEHRIEMDNEHDTITISDKDRKNRITLKTKEGQEEVEIVAAKKLTVKIGDNITLTMNGSNGTVELSASKLNFRSTDAMKLESNGRLEAVGANATLKGNSMTKVESSGPVSISATPVKLG